MRLSSLVLGCLACLAAAALPPASKPSTAPSDPPAAPLTAADLAEFDAIIRQLSDDDWRRRQSAKLKLARLGPEFAAHLRKFAGETPRQDARDGCLEALA